MWFILFVISIAFAQQTTCFDGLSVTCTAQDSCSADLFSFEIDPLVDRRLISFEGNDFYFLVSANTFSLAVSNGTYGPGDSRYSCSLFAAQQCAYMDSRDYGDGTIIDFSLRCSETEPNTNTTGDSTSNPSGGDGSGGSSSSASGILDCLF